MDTCAVLEPDAKHCTSRSLFLDRFANPEAREKEVERKQWFERLIAKPVAMVRPLPPLPPGTPPPLYAQLQSRLMVNMAGGVMENAGLCLDRFGMPYIPGSAVKGCARRAALAALHEWTTTGTKPGSAPDDADNLFSEACRPFASPEEMLARIALVFGWTDSDWKDSRSKKGQPKSDFVWATEHSETGNPAATASGRSGVEIRHRAASILADHLGIESADETVEPWTKLPSFGGSVAFFAAQPQNLGGTNRLPGLPLSLPPIGNLELDVLTCHHAAYYSRAVNQAKQPVKPVATDDEDPIPVMFPTIAPGHVFAFPLYPLSRSGVGEAHARTWLITGLEVFGLGAKTAAGYGWFDGGKSVQEAVTRVLQVQADRHRQAAEERAEKAKAEAKAKAQAAEKAARDEALAGLSGEARADKEVEFMTTVQFEQKVRAFHKESKKGGPAEELRPAIVRALRGYRKDIWLELKDKAKRGGEWATAADAIRAVSRKLLSGNEGKMP
jgi:CRISPR/Cas system CMR subunit Cmr6 (Cas7 group RAMP superfamily)